MFDRFLVENGCQSHSGTQRTLEPAMKHNGVEYRVMQAANSTSWMWSVDLAAGRRKTGLALSREAAILGAVGVIDKLLESAQGHLENLVAVP